MTNSHYGHFLSWYGSQHADHTMRLAFYAAAKVTSTRSEARAVLAFVGLGGHNFDVAVNAWLTASATGDSATSQSIDPPPDGGRFLAWYADQGDIRKMATYQHMVVELYTKWWKSNRTSLLTVAKMTSTLDEARAVLALIGLTDQEFNAAVAAWTEAGMPGGEVDPPPNGGRSGDIDPPPDGERSDQEHMRDASAEPDVDPPPNGG